MLGVGTMTARDQGGAGTLSRRHEPYLNLSEVFGPTVQGEGPWMGRPAVFLRLAGCNLTCSWCDSKYTWDWEHYDRAAEVTRLTVPEVVDRLAAIFDGLPGAARLIVTGGEPLVQAFGLSKLLPALHYRLSGRLAGVDVETNGTRPLRGTLGMWDTIICSPKVIPSSGTVHGGCQLVDDVLHDPVAVTKFVVDDRDDLAAVDEAVDRWRLEPSRVWVMPQGITADEITSGTGWLADEALARGWRFSSRLQVYAWDDKRGH